MWKGSFYSKNSVKKVPQRTFSCFTKELSHTMIRVWNAILVIQDLAKIHRGIREKLTEYEIWLLPGSGIHHKLGTDAYWKRKRYFPDSDDRSSGCGILVKNERECGTGRNRTGPLFPDPERFYVSLPIHLTINRLMTATKDSVKSKSKQFLYGHNYQV